MWMFTSFDVHRKKLYSRVNTFNSVMTKMKWVLKYISKNICLLFVLLTFLAIAGNSDDTTTFAFRLLS